MCSAHECIWIVNDRFTEYGKLKSNHKWKEKFSSPRRRTEPCSATMRAVLLLFCSLFASLVVTKRSTKTIDAKEIKPAQGLAGGNDPYCEGEEAEADKDLLSIADNALLEEKGKNDNNGVEALNASASASASAEVGSALEHDANVLVDDDDESTSDLMSVPDAEGFMPQAVSLYEGGWVRSLIFGDDSDEEERAESDEDEYDVLSSLNDSDDESTASSLSSCDDEEADLLFEMAVLPTTDLLSQIKEWLPKMKKGHWKVVEKVILNHDGYYPLRHLHEPNNVDPDKNDLSRLEERKKWIEANNKSVLIREKIDRPFRHIMRRLHMASVVRSKEKGDEPRPASLLLNGAIRSVFPWKLVDQFQSHQAFVRDVKALILKIKLRVQPQDRLPLLTQIYDTLRLAGDQLTVNIFTLPDPLLDPLLDFVDEIMNECTFNNNQCLVT